MTKKKPTTIKVMVGKPKPTPVKKKKPKATLVPAPGMNAALANYKAALSQPFSTEANGARVPDMYSVPTSTRRITRTCTLTTDASGNGDVVILPNAFMHLFCTQGTLNTGTTATTGSGTSYQCMVTNTTALSGTLANYRIVGYGVRVIGTQNDTTAQGRLYAATVPVSSWVNSIDTVGGQPDNSSDPAQTMGAWLNDLGIPNVTNKVAIGTMPSLASSVLTSIQRVNETPLSVTPKISSPEGFNFRLTRDSTIGFASTDQTSASYVHSGDASYLRVAGHEAVVLGVGGASVSSPILEIEVVYHLEGTASTVNNTDPLAAANDKIVVNPIGWMNIVAQVANTPSFRLALETAGNAVIPGLGTLANRLY